MTPDANVQRMADTVLVVEDDHSVRALLRMLLEDEGLDVLAAASGLEAVELFGNAHVDLVLLDIRLPGFDGFEVCRRIRRLSNVPIIMVTAQQDSHDVVAGLELGADDYVTKPFNDRELMARVRTQLRRLQLSSAADSDIIRVGDLEIRAGEGTVTKAGERLSLTKTEFQLLVHLARNLNLVLSREQLLEHVWGYAYHGDGRLVDTHIARLRAKIESSPAQPALLHTVRGLGYRLSVTP